MSNSNPEDMTVDPDGNPIRQVGGVSAAHPQRIGRYRIERVLGKGGFGLVYLAQDEQLTRLVAVKVPHAQLILKPEDAEAYLTEARTVANLDHSGIVPVFDVGSSDDYPCYVVSKYIEGVDLAAKLKQHRLKYREAAEIVATVAEALHYAHKQGLVHRDVKPGNILIGKDDQPYVVDFGLALREENIGKGPKCAGTAAYMSPEQARGEGHRVDGRSDVFSLGVVLYQLLAGRQPFRGDTEDELLEQVTSYEARPLRQYDDSIPKELERICHKAMAKRVSERYSSAHDMAEDLRHFLTEQSTIQGSSMQGGTTAVESEAKSSAVASTSVDSNAASSVSLGLGSSDNQRIRIVPKGLRSFDAHDADFFLELLPGPRDREGLPDSLRFWKTRIEETDADNTFPVGLIYGPSGCGKSSLVKAGLLPRLSENLITVYIEATSEETETRLLHGLRKRCSGVEEDLSLKDTLAALRRGQGIPVGKKVLIVLDQFEQWLHARKEEQNTDLVQALRQCDGGRVQCIVMVRDDFWLAVSRFLRDLEVRLLEGENSALADLFDLDHARKVLAAFGRAFGRLPENISDTTAEQKDFLKQSVAGLAEDGKVICVRLALFAEMMKGKSWTSATLKEVGGTTGVGVTFLEETFSASTAPPECRLHQTGARAVLRALSPNSGTNIKGEMKSRDELLAASGYARRPRDFEDLIRILDSEIRLITPTDPEGVQSEDDEQQGVSSHTASQRYYQLTHDYLVPSLREWLTRKQKETRKGRAELKLAERSSLWNVKRESRHLPSLTEWLSIRILTNSGLWTDAQRLMMKRADGFHLFRSATVAVVAALITTGALWTRQRVEQNKRELLAQKSAEQEATRIEGLVGELISAEPDQLPSIVKKLDANPDVAATFLLPRVSSEPTTPVERRAQLHAQLAVVSSDRSLVKPLTEELLTNKVTYVGPIRQQLQPYAAELRQEFQGILRDEKASADRRFRSALALAEYIPVSDAAVWTKQDLQFVARQLVASNAEFQPLLREYLRPIDSQLLSELETIYVDPQASDGQRLSAANAFADYTASDVPKLTRLLMVATPEQYGVLYPLVASNIAPATEDDLVQLVAKLPVEEPGSGERVPHGQKRASAAVTLLRLGEREKVLPVFAVMDDPEALTQFIFRCRERDVRVEELLECLRLVIDGPVDRYPRNSRYALLLALGEYVLDDIPEPQQELLLTQLGDLYRNDPSSGVHGAAGWLLRKWGHAEIVRKVDQTAIPYSADREWFTLAITVTPQSPQVEVSADENAATQAETEAGTAVEGTVPQDEEPRKNDESGNTESAKGEAEPEPPAAPLPPRTFYYTFIVFPPGQSMIGSVDDETGRQKEEIRRQVTLTQSFALLDREITFEELMAFGPKYEDFMQQSEAKPEDAGFGAHWYEAVGFCRWLSQQSGLSESDQSYADPESLDQEQFPREPKPEINWAPRDWPLEFGRRGFRLPTDSEWEVACRAGVRTGYGYGSDAALLKRFGWFAENSGGQVHSPREKCPGFRGLFDMHGNLFEWTHDWYGDYEDAALVDPVKQKKGSGRVLRGGSWSSVAAGCRSADRVTSDPTSRTSNYGFRLALSCPSGPSLESEQDK